MRFPVKIAELPWQMSPKRDGARRLIDGAGIVLLYLVIFATMAAVGLLAWLVWLLIW
jgi:hypothetical protein